MDMSKIKTNIINFSNKAFRVIIITILAVLSLMSLISTTHIDNYENVYYVSDSPITIVLLIGVSVAIIWILKWKLTIKVDSKWVWGIGMVATTLVFVYVIATQYMPRFDQLHVMSIAAQMINDCFIEFEPGGYAEIYPYQNGILVFNEILAIVFGPQNALAIQVINIVLMAVSVVALYGILKYLFADTFKPALILLMLFIPFWGYATLIYGNVPGFSCGMCSVFFYIRFLKQHGEGKMYNVILSGILMGLSCALKMNFEILMIAIIVVTIFELLNDFNAKYIAAIVCVMLLTVGIDKGADKIVEYQTKIATARGIPSMSYIAMGLHEHSDRGAGWHDNYPEDTYAEYENDAELTEKAAKEEILYYISFFKSHPRYMVGFFTRKIASMWNEPSYDSLSMQMGRKSVFGGVPNWISNIVNKGKWNSYIYNIMNYMESWIFIGALLYYVYSFKSTDLTKDIFGVYFVGGFICHIFWEASSQYAIFYVMLLIPYAYEGYINLINKLINSTKNKKIYYSIMALVCLLLISIPKFKNITTLTRDDMRYMQYLEADDN